MEVMSPPGVGSELSCDWLKLVEMFAFSVFRTGGDEVTSMVSVFACGDAVRFTTCTAPTETSAWVVAEVKPFDVALIEYLPGFSSDTRYAPASFVVVVRLAPVFR